MYNGLHFIPSSLTEKMQYLVRHCLHRVLRHQNVMIYDHFNDALAHIKDAFTMYNVVVFKNEVRFIDKNSSEEVIQKKEKEAVQKFLETHRDAISKNYSEK